MSGGETAEPEAAKEAELAGEPRQMSERTAKAILLVIVMGVMWGIVAAAPWVAYVVVGILGTLGWQKVRGWINRRQRSDDEDAGDEQEPDSLDVLIALQFLGRGGANVLLTELRKELGVADTKAVKALLDEKGVRWREGVRTPAGNGPGVHRDDIPPLSPVGGDPVEGVVVAGEDANANANNTDGEEPEEGIRVQRIGSDGYIVYEPKDIARHHRVK